MVISFLILLIFPAKSRLLLSGSCCNLHQFRLYPLSHFSILQLLSFPSLLLELPPCRIPHPTSSPQTAFIKRFECLYLLATLHLLTSAATPTGATLSIVPSTSSSPTLGVLDHSLATSESPSSKELLGLRVSTLGL